MDKNVFGATGRRKEATARVEIKPGKGEFTVNGADIGAYLTRETLVNHAQAPLRAVEWFGKLDVRCSTNGGGLSGQAGAIRLAVARALTAMDPELQSALRKGGYMTRDPREVERKKYGQPKARKRFQYSKR